MGFRERRSECLTDTQHIVNLSAYHWAIRVLGNIAGLRVLDAACGTGYGSYVLATRARSVVGVDRDLATIDEARRSYKHPNMCFLVMNCEALAFKDVSFDVILSFETIEHLDNDRQFLCEVTRLLAPDGRLILSTPHGKALGISPENPFHRREYTWYQLQDLLAEHFDSVRLFGRRLSPRLAGLERKLNRVRGYDPFDLRRFFPRKIRHRIGSIISKSRGGIGLNETSTADVEYYEGLRSSSTLLAICRVKTD